MSNQPIFRGAATAIITPMREGTVDYDAYGKLIDWQLAQGINVKQNLQEAVLLMKNAADKGEAMAQFNYAMMLHLGIGVPKSELEASRYFRYAARLGIKEALQFIAHDRHMTL